MALEPNYIQNWKELYKELCEKVSTALPDIKWQDLWQNQVGFLEEEHPFPAPAIFYGFTILSTEDGGSKSQDVDLQVDVYHYFETFDDTYDGSYNQDSALAFLDSISDVFRLLHATSGTYYSEMRRIGFRMVDTGDAGNLYVQQFVCKMRDLSALPEYEGVIPGDINLEEGIPATANTLEKPYIIKT